MWGSRAFAVKGLTFVRWEKVAIVKDTFILKQAAIPQMRVVPSLSRDLCVTHGAPPGIER
jgi:hypothetical protein